MNALENGRPWLSVREVAGHFGCSEKTILRRIHAEILPASPSTETGGPWLIHRDDIASYEHRLRSGPKIGRGEA